MTSEKLNDSSDDNKSPNLMLKYWHEDRTTLFQLLSSLSILILILLSSNVDLFAWLTIGLGSILILMVCFYILLLPYLDQPQMEGNIHSISIVASVLMVLGMFIGNFNAAFSTFIPFSYYFLMATLITLQLVFSISEYRSYSKD